MATIEEMLRERLIGEEEGNEELKAILGDRIFPNSVPPEETPAPWVYYDVTESVPIEKLGGPATLAWHIVEFEVFSETYAEAKSIGLAVKTLLDGWRSGVVKRAFWAGSSSQAVEGGYNRTVRIKVQGPADG